VEILQNRVDNDFGVAQSQVPAAKMVANQIQIGLNNNIFDQSDLPNLTAFANYLLDGETPTKSTIAKDQNGKDKYFSFIDTKMQERFDKLNTKINQKKIELSKPQTSTTPCADNH
jgi:hypothetical protein